MNREELLALPPGSVLERFPEEKIRVKVMIPRHVNECEKCMKAVTSGNVIRIEKGTQCMGTECVDCYLETKKW